MVDEAGISDYNCTEQSFKLKRSPGKRACLFVRRAVGDSQDKTDSRGGRDEADDCNKRQGCKLLRVLAGDYYAPPKL
ncbi:hypothetical protein L0M92_04830 [Casaltella massiliensis]|nr:hypothetical protein [Casaltella massiliensis]